jgi:hypothetical protein
MERKSEVVIEVEAIKIIGIIKGTNRKIELIMDEDVFFEWINKLNKKHNDRKK